MALIPTPFDHLIISMGHTKGASMANIHGTQQDPTTITFNAGGNTYSFSNPNDSFDSELLDHPSEFGARKSKGNTPRVCVSMIDGVAEMPNDDSIQPQVRKCSERKTACIARQLKEK